MSGVLAAGIGVDLGGCFVDLCAYYGGEHGFEGVGILNGVWIGSTGTASRGFLR